MLCQLSDLIKHLNLVALLSGVALNGVELLQQVLRREAPLCKALDCFMQAVLRENVSLHQNPNLSLEIGLRQRA